jgi:hypothetical protein
MNVSVVIPTRGDVDLVPVTESFPPKWEVLTYDNGAGVVQTWKGAKWGVVADGLPDRSVYARYACIEYAQHGLILTQDDDVIVSDPQAIVAAYEQACISQWFREAGRPGWTQGLRVGHLDGLVANMPQEFRHDGYTDSCLVGFGACFHRDAPGKAFEKYNASGRWGEPREMYLRTCDVVFTTLTPRVLVDVPKENLPYATDASRMYRQPDHVGERTRMLELARKVRDA